jgi:hypothetical protein
MKISLIWASANLATVAAVLALVTSTALAEKKSVTYTNQMGPVLSRTSAIPGDRPDHEIVQATRQDMTTSPDPDWNAVPAINYGQSDLVGGSGTVSGYAVRTHKNGDKTFYSYLGKIWVVTEEGAKLTMGEGTVELIGGTGKFAKAKGSGTWTSGKGGMAVIKMDLEY